MMVRTLQISGVLALTAAAATFALCLRNCWRSDPYIADISTLSVTERLKQERSRGDLKSHVQLSPLVQQAQIFAAYLNPPPEPKEKALSQPMAKSTVVAQAPEIKPANTSPEFKLYGISYRPSRPEDSMALIWQPDTGPRWVKEGTQLGHTTIVEIGATAVEYRTQEQTHTMLVDPEYQASPTGRKGGPILASRRTKNGSEPDRTVAANTVLPRQAPNSQPVHLAATPDTTSRPPMRRYRLGR